MYLTKQKILQIAKKARILKGATIYWDEPGVAIICLKNGLTWDRLDGDRATEGFVFDEDLAEQPRDTVEYLQDRLSEVEPV